MMCVHCAAFVDELVDTRKWNADKLGGATIDFTNTAVLRDTPLPKFIDPTIFGTQPL